MNPAVSNDGRHIAFSAIENGKRRIWVHDIDRATRVPLTRDFYVDAQPAWSPSDESIYFTSNRSDAALYEGRIGTLDIARKAVDHELQCAEVSVSGDGKYLAFITVAISDESNPYDIWQQSLSEDAIAAPIIATAANEMLPAISPDGRYVAFMSDQTGRWEVFVASSPDGATIWGPLSTEGGIQPKWYGMDELIYVDDRGLMSVKLELDNGFSWEKPVRVLAEQNAGVVLVDRSKLPISVRYDVDPSRESFIMVQDVSGHDTGIIVI
jgi:serine/threonine-protein kinase